MIFKTRDETDIDFAWYPKLLCLLDTDIQH